jgi:hypothetical protein
MQGPDFLRCAKKFLKAGAMEDGISGATDMGAPQGGNMSPVLSNACLQCALDMRFAECFRKSAKGAAEMAGAPMARPTASSSRKTPKGASLS